MKKVRVTFEALIPLRKLIGEKELKEDYGGNIHDFISHLYDVDGSVLLDEVYLKSTELVELKSRGDV